jgi:hypothetical protein
MPARDAKFGVVPHPLCKTPLPAWDHPGNFRDLKGPSEPSLFRVQVPACHTSHTDRYVAGGFHEKTLTVESKVPQVPHVQTGHPLLPAREYGACRLI